MRTVCGKIKTIFVIGDAILLFRRYLDVMDPRKFFKRLARDLGLLKTDSSTQRKSEKVSEPVNFEHRVHVAVDGDSGRFVGLPPQWRRVVGRQPDHDVSYPENSHSVPRRNLTQRNRQILDDNALDHTLSRTNTGNFTSFATSLETPRSRASVADNQDLIIERLKRELRDYKARNSHAFEESTEDMFGNLNRVPLMQFSPLDENRSHVTLPIFSNNFHESEELVETALLTNELGSKNNGNYAQTTKTLHSPSPTKHANANGKITAQSPTKLNGIKSNGNPKALRRSESEV